MTPDVIKELTQYTVTATFKDQDGDPVTPASVSYRLIDTATGTNIIPATTVVAADASATITIPAAANTCTTAGTRREYKQLIITATDLAQTEHLYLVERVPAPA